MESFDTSSFDTEAYPKVLIIGESFHTHSGGGITQSNLFRDWPKGCLAIIPYVKDTTDPAVCDRIYSIHEKEIKYLFPFNLVNLLFQRVIQNVIEPPNYSLKDKTDQEYNSNYKNREQSFVQKPESLSGQNKKLKMIKSLKRISRSINGFFGFDHFKDKIVVSSELLQWIREFNPDLIYSQFAERDKIRFINDLKSVTNLPLVVHFMDDWPSTLVSPGIFHNYWERKIDKELRRLIDSASACIGISEKMADEYEIRYKRNFTYFHNPVDIDKWLPYSKTSWEVGPTFKILYAGGASKAIIKSINSIAESVQKLNSNNIAIEFHLYTKDFIEADLQFATMNAIHVHEPIPYSNQIPKLFSSYDLLLIPLDFDSRFMTLSMPTKVSEYMISGTPILIFAPKDTALTEYALKYHWGYVVYNNEASDIEHAILDFFHNESTRRKYGHKAKEIALTRHDSNKIRSNFRELLCTQIKIT